MVLFVILFPQLFLPTAGPDTDERRYIATMDNARDFIVWVSRNGVPWFKGSQLPSIENVIAGTIEYEEMKGEYTDDNNDHITLLVYKKLICALHRWQSIQSMVLGDHVKLALNQHVELEIMKRRLAENSRHMNRR